MANNELNLHIAARTAMMHVAVVLTNLGDARNSTLDDEEMALIQARLADLNRAFIETGLLAAPAQGEPSDALPELPAPVRYAQWTGGFEMAYTEEQMRAYAKQAIESRILGQQGGSDAWISVEDQLPGKQGQDSEEVLCFLSGHCASTDMACRQGAGWGIRLGYYDAEKGMFRTHGRPDDSVTHWQPLPLPPAIQAQAGDAPKGGSDV